MWNVIKIVIHDFSILSPGKRGYNGPSLHTSHEGAYTYTNMSTLQYCANIHSLHVYFLATHSQSSNQDQQIIVFKAKSRYVSLCDKHPVFDVYYH